MKKFIFRKIISLPLTFLGITIILFSLINILPPQTLATSYASTEKELSDEEVHQIIKKYELDAPVIKRYIKWLKNVLKGELGYSYTAHMKSIDAIKTYLPATIELTIFTIIPIFIFGNILGLNAARRKNKKQDRIITSISSFFYSLPSFVIGIFVLFLFYGIIGIFEPGRYSIQTDVLISSGRFTKYTNFMIIDSILNLNFNVLIDTLKHIFLPAFSIFLGTSALFIKITRNSAIEEMNKDYVRTLKAKGLDEEYIIKKHIRKNIMIPQLTVGGLQLIRLLGGVVITETIFDWPGIGMWGVKSALGLDISGVMSFAIVVSILFLIGNLIIDILYYLVDPRIRYE